MVAFLESFVNNGSRASFSQRSYGGSQLNSLRGTSPLLENMTTLMVVHGQRSYVEAQVGEGQSQEFASSCRGKVGISKDVAGGRQQHYPEVLEFKLALIV